MDDGIYFGLPAAEYHADPALGSSGIKDLLISPLTYSVNAALKGADDSTAAKDKGNAFHKRLLEGPEAFAQHYAVKPSKDDYPDAIDGVKALQARCSDLGLTKSGTIAELCARIRQADPDAVLWPDIMAAFEAENAGKEIISADTMAEIDRHARIVEVHEGAMNAFRGGVPEVSMFWHDEHGIPCKLRTDYLKVRAAVDLKSFSNSLGLPVDDAVGRQMANYGYFVQGVHYMSGIEATKALYRSAGRSIVHGDAPAKEWLDAFAAPEPHRFFFVFLETGMVPNTRIREFRARAKPKGEHNAYWLAGEMKIAKAKEVYLACMNHYGPDRPWVDTQPARPFEDEDFPLYALS